MTRLVLTAVAVFAVLWILLTAGVLPAPLDMIVGRALGLVCSLACPLTFVLLILAPGIFRDVAGDWNRFWERLRTRRNEVEELERKITHLDRAHHMVQLGNVFARQGRDDKAITWFRRALEKEPDHLEALYRLAICYFNRGDFQQAAELLEKVNSRKPEHDYGMAYLRLAEAHHRLGHLQRAAEVYETLLRFYPGQPEGSYHFAELLEEQGEHQRAAKLMRDVIFTVKHSPPFHRRRNRHWLLKAKWWLWRH